MFYIICKWYHTGHAPSLPSVDLAAGFIIVSKGRHVHFDGLMKLTIRYRAGKSLRYRKPLNSRVMVSHQEITPFVDAQEEFLTRPRPVPTTIQNNCGDYTANKLESPEGKVPGLALPCLAFALPCLAVGIALSCLALPCLALPCLALPCLALPCLALPCRAVPCRALPFLALPCLALGLALPCLLVAC